MREQWWEQGATRVASIVVLACVILSVLFGLVSFLPFGHVSFSHEEDVVLSSRITNTSVAHIHTPSAVKAVYMTACVAGEKKLRDKVLAVMQGTELNALMIDYKDYTGTISYASTSLQTKGDGRGCRIPDLPAFIALLHSKGIYTIGRITTFQDPLYASEHVDVAIRSRSHPDRPWKDTHGLAYIDPGARAYWDRVVAMAKEAHDIGFDEINFDYIRFPSDGVLSDMLISTNASTTKATILKGFFSYLHSQLQGTGTVTSADVFGLITVATGDMGIGQVLENTFPYFDYVAPMVYPSHFASGFDGFAHPAEHPYEVIHDSMTGAVVRAVSATTSPDKLRPWIQAFDLGTAYTPAMVRDQMRGVYDSGLNSWMIWNAGSVYTKAYLEDVSGALYATTSATSTR